jgi:hypothetical protein
MVDLNQLISDPQFTAASPEVKKRVLQRLIPEYSSKSPAVQDAVISRLGEMQPQQQPIQPQISLVEPGYSKPIGFAETSAQDIDLSGIKTDIKTAIGNVPKSGARFIEDLITPYLHPIETAKAVGNLGIGAVEKLIPGKQEKEKFADDLVSFIKERYGSPEAFKSTLIEDPVGVVADIAGLISGAGAAVKGVGAVSKVQRISDVGKAITKVGTSLEPVSAVGKAGKAAAGKFISPERPSKMFMESAKFSTVLSDKDRLKITETALKNSIMPNSKGLDKLRRGINAFNDEIDSLIDAAQISGARIPVKRLLRNFRSLTKEKLATSGKPIQAQRQINNIRRQIVEANRRLGRKELTPTEAQNLKKSIYKETETHYSNVRQSPASIEAQQAVAKAAKESLEEIFPEIGELNKKEGALIELRNAIEKSSNRIGNRDFAGLGITAKAGTGGVIGGVPGALLGVAFALYDTPLVKAKLAIVANRLKKQGIIIDPDSNLAKVLEATVSTGKRQAAFQAGRITEQNE